MLRLSFLFIALFVSLVSIGNVEASYDNFACKCLSIGPGVDNMTGEKLCSYSCNCTGFNQNEAPVSNLKINLEQVLTTAKSRDTWDSGSLICHGQYAYKGRLDDPNWKIQVRFSPFTVTSFEGTEVIYGEADQSVEVSANVRYQLKRTKKAPEIIKALRNQL